MSATCLCRSVVVSVNIFCQSVFVCELTFGQLPVGELSHNAFFTSEKSKKNIMHGRVKMYVMR